MFPNYNHPDISPKFKAMCDRMEEERAALHQEIETACAKITNIDQELADMKAEHSGSEWQEGRELLEKTAKLVKSQQNSLINFCRQRLKGLDEQQSQVAKVKIHRNMQSREKIMLRDLNHTLPAAQKIQGEVNINGLQCTLSEGSEFDFVTMAKEHFLSRGFVAAKSGTIKYRGDVSGYNPRSIAEAFGRLVHDAEPLLRVENDPKGALSEEYGMGRVHLTVRFDRLLSTDMEGYQPNVIKVSCATRQRHARV